MKTNLIVILLALSLIISPVVSKSTASIFCTGMISTDNISERVEVEKTIESDGEWVILSKQLWGKHFVLR